FTFFTFFFNFEDFLGSQIASHHEIRPPLVQPQPNDFPRFTAQPPFDHLDFFQSPPDVLNNIIVHIYLNAKDKHSHTVATSPLIKGVFGIGTAHGGLGTHTDPIVITKDFDRDTLEFVEEDKGPANIVEVKATVSSPDRKIENTVNKAVSTELERAIPAVINRLQGPMSTMDSELRKELEQALVEELAKNLGNTIDQMETKISDEDLGRLIGMIYQHSMSVKVSVEEENILNDHWYEIKIEKIEKIKEKKAKIKKKASLSSTRRIVKTRTGWLPGLGRAVISAIY
uniref:PHB domain-containing protein n=1 Tax=Angiostrongylus cantonensis TaxID=6313 RepID=A0A0K0D429_ANGCA